MSCNANRYVFGISGYQGSYCLWTEYKTKHICSARNGGNMETFLMYFLFALGVVFIIKGGDWFVDGAVWVAEITGIPKFIIGATVISVATTLPEILVSTIAAVDGRKILASRVGDFIAASQDKVGMAIGNGIGSVICNTAMILAVSIIFMPIKLRGRDFAPKAFWLLAALTVLFLFSLSGSLSLVGAFALLLIFALYILENIRSARKSGAEEREEHTAPGESNTVNNILQLVIGAAGIVIGSELLVNNGSAIAASLGVSEALIGVTIVAVGTSLPELVTAAASVIKKQSSMSVGNIIGANIIDTTLILAVCSFIYGGNLPVSAQNIYLDFPAAILVTLIAVVPTVIRKKFSRRQGVVMLAVYIIYLIIVIGKLDWYLSLFGAAV